MMWILQDLGWILIVLTAIFVILLCRRVRYACAYERYLGKECCKKKVAKIYETYLHSFVIVRQILLFLFPTAILMALSALLATKLEHLFSSFILGLSILIFVSMQLPLLMKAHVLVTFQIEPGRGGSEIDVESGKTTRIELGIRNLGYGTYKNSTVIFYLGSDFEIVPYDNSLYKDLDFKKKISIQKRHGGVLFNPKDKFLSIPPQEIFVFPVWVKVPNKKAEREATIYFFSENTWGMVVIKRQVRIN